MKVRTRMLVVTLMALLMLVSANVMSSPWTSEFGGINEFASLDPDTSQNKEDARMPQSPIFSLSEQGLTEWSGQSTELPTMAYGNRIDMFEDNQNRYFPSNGSTSDTSVFVPMGAGWEGQELFVEVYELTENRTWFVDPEMEVGGAPWSLGTVSVGGGAAPEANWLPDGHGSGNDCVEFRMTSPDGDPSTGERAYARQNVAVDRGDVVWAGFRLDYWIDSAWGADGFVAVYVSIETNDYTQRVWQRSFADVTQAQTWFDSGLVVLQDLSIFDLSDGLDIEVGLYSQQSVNYWPDLDPEARVDNVELYIMTLTDPSDVNLQVNGLDVNDFVVGASTIPGLGNRTHVPATEWTSNPLQVNFTWTPSPSTPDPDREIRVDFSVRTTLYARGAGATVTTQDPAAFGESFTASNASEIEYLTWFHADIPEGYDEEYYFNISLPENRDVYFVGSPLLTSENITDWDEGHGPGWYANISAFEHLDRWGYWLVRSHGSNMITNILMVNSTTGRTSEFLGLRAHDTTRFVVEVGAQFAGIEVNLTVYDPSGTEWYSEAAIVNGTGYAETRELTFGVNATAGQWLVQALCNNSMAGSAWNKTGFFSRSFEVTHASFSELLNPADAVVTWTTNVTRPDLFLVRIRINDSDIPSIAVSGGQMSYNWTTGTEYFSDSGTGQYTVTLDSGDLAQKGEYTINIDWVHPYFDAISDVLTVYLNLDAEIVLEVPDSPGLSIPSGYNESFRVRFEDDIGNPIDYGIVDCNWSSYYSVKPVTGSPGSYIFWLNTTFVGLGEYVIAVTGEASFILPQTYLVYVEVRELYTRIWYLQNVLEIPLGEASDFTVDWIDADHELPLIGLNNSIEVNWTGSYSVDEISPGTYNITMFTEDADTLGTYPVKVTLSGSLMQNQSFVIQVIVRPHNTFFTLDEPVGDTPYGEEVVILVFHLDTDFSTGTSNATGDLSISVTTPGIVGLQYVVSDSTLGVGHFNITIQSGQWSTVGWKNLTIQISWTGPSEKYQTKTIQTTVRLVGTQTDLYLEVAPVATYYLDNFTFSAIFWDVVNSTPISNTTGNVLVSITPIGPQNPVSFNDFLISIIQEGPTSVFYRFELNSTHLEGVGSFNVEILFQWRSGRQPFYENRTLAVALLVLERPTYVDYGPVSSTPYGEEATYVFSYVDSLSTMKIRNSSSLLVSLNEGGVSWSLAYDSALRTFTLVIDTTSLGAAGQYNLHLNLTWVGEPFYQQIPSHTFSIIVTVRSTQLAHLSFAPEQYGNNVSIEFIFTDLVAQSTSGMTGLLSLNITKGWYTVSYLGNGHFVAVVNTSAPDFGSDGVFSINASIVPSAPNFANAHEVFSFAVLKRSTQLRYESPDPTPYLDHVTFGIAYNDDSTGRGVTGAQIALDCTNSSQSLVLNSNYWLTELGSGQYLIEVNSTALGAIGTYFLNVTVSYTGAPYYQPASRNVNSRVSERDTQTLITQTPGETPFLENITLRFRYEDYLTKAMIPIDKSHVTLTHGVTQDLIPSGSYTLYDFGTFFEIRFNSTILNPTTLVTGHEIQLEIDRGAGVPYYAVSGATTVAATIERPTQILFPLVEEVPYFSNITIELDYIDFLSSQGIEGASIDIVSNNWTIALYQVEEVGGGSYRVYINTTLFGGVGTANLDITATKGGVPFYSTRMTTGVPASIRPIITTLQADPPSPGSTAVGVPIVVILTLVDFDHGVPLEGATLTSDWTTLYSTSHQIVEVGNGVYNLTLDMTGLTAQDYPFTVQAQKLYYQTTTVDVSVTPGASTFTIVLAKTAVFATWGEIPDIRLDVRESYYFSLVPGANVTLLWNGTIFQFDDLGNGTYTLDLDTTASSFGIYSPQISVSKQYYQTRQTSFTLVVSKAPGHILSLDPDTGEVRTFRNIVLNTATDIIVYLNDTIRGDPVVATSVTMEWNNTVYVLVANGTPGFYTANLDVTGFDIGPYELVMSAASLNHVFLDAVVDINVDPISTDIGLASGATALFVVQGDVLSILVEYNDTYYGGFISGANVTYTIGALAGTLTEEANATYSAVIDTSDLPAQTIFLRITGAKTDYATTTKTLIVTIQPVPTEVTVDTLLNEGYHDDVVDFTFYYNDTHRNAPIVGAFATVSWDGGAGDVTDLGNGSYLVEITLTPTSPRLYDINVAFTLQNFTTASTIVRVVILATPAMIVGPSDYSVPVNHTAQVIFNVENTLTNETIPGLNGIAYWDVAGAVPLTVLENGSYAIEIPDDLPMATYRIEIGFTTSVYSMTTKFLDLTVRPVRTRLLTANTTISTSPGSGITIVITYLDVDHGTGISGVIPTVTYFEENITYFEDRLVESSPGVYELPFLVTAGRTFTITVTFAKDQHETKSIVFTINSDISAEQILVQNLALGGGFIFIILSIAIVAYVRVFSIPKMVRIINKMIAALAGGKIPKPADVPNREAMVLEIVNEGIQPAGITKTPGDLPGPSIEAIVPEIEDLLEHLAAITGLREAELEAFRQDLSRMKASERPGFIREVIEQEEARRAEALEEDEEARRPEEAKEVLEQKPEELEELRVKLRRKGMSNDEIDITIEQAKGLSKADLEALLDSLGIRL